MEIIILPRFRKDFKKLPSDLQEEVFEKISLFKETKNHKSLHVHQLHGRMKGAWSFSVNYRYRIVFQWENKKKAAILINIGDHSIYQ